MRAAAAGGTPEIAVKYRPLILISQSTAHIQSLLRVVKGLDAKYRKTIQINARSKFRYNNHWTILRIIMRSSFNFPDPKLEEVLM